MGGPTGGRDARAKSLLLGCHAAWPGDGAGANEAAIKPIQMAVAHTADAIIVRFMTLSSIERHEPTRGKERRE